MTNVEVMAWTINYVPIFYMDVIPYLCSTKLDPGLDNLLVIMAPGSQQI